MTCLSSDPSTVEIGSSESWDSHSQKPVSPSDKRGSPIQHLSSISVQNALLHFVGRL